jgi:hypothetical protein
VQRPGWLQLPLLLVFYAEPKDGAAELLAAVRARDGGPSATRLRNYT